MARRFKDLLESYPKPDGRTWGGQELQEATGGVVTRSYVSNLRKGRIENPGYDKLAALAKVMGFSPAEWFEEHSLGGNTPTGVDRELVEALRDRTIMHTVRELSRLPGRDRRLVLGIVRQFGTATSDSGGGAGQAL